MERSKFNVNGTEVDVIDANAVKFDRAQSLTGAQKQRARENIGANDIDTLLPHILSAKNYVSLMRLWFSTNGAAALADFSALCDRWYTLTRSGWTGGTRFYHWPGSGSSEGTKVGDNAGMVAEPSTNETAGRPSPPPRPPPVRTIIRMSRCSTAWTATGRWTRTACPTSRPSRGYVEALSGIIPENWWASFR